MQTHAQPNLASLFFDRARDGGDRPFLWARRGGVWTSISWNEAARRIRRVALSLRQRGIGPGDRVVLVSENRPEWLLADLAILSAGAVTVPSYVTGTMEDHRHIVQHSGARAVIVSSTVLLARLREAAATESQAGLFVILDPPAPADLPGAGADVSPGICTWEDLLSGAADDPAAVTASCGRLGRGDLACLAYTSGTSGPPKGVMLSHGAILSNLEGAYERFVDLGLEDQVFLSVLPISHAYEHTAGQFFPIFLGAQIRYLDNVSGIATALRECRPTLMTAVPRLLEVMHDRLLREARQGGRLRRRLFDATWELGRRRVEDANSLSAWERLQDRLCERLVRARVRAHFGGRLQAIISGGAPLRAEHALFFNALGLRVLQGYGLTEAAPVVSCNPPFRPKHNTVGPALPGVELRLAEDGEILVRGELNMLGYWKDPEESRRSLEGGWLHTGDIGELDAEGYLSITDRKKDIIKNSGGERISPLRVELALSAEPEIAQAVVFGDGRPQLVAVLVPEEKFVEEWAGARGVRAELAHVAEYPEFHEAISAAVERANRGLSPPERVRRFLVARDAFRADNGLLTPTLKAKRHLVEERYGEELGRL